MHTRLWPVPLWVFMAAGAVLVLASSAVATLAVSSSTTTLSIAEETLERDADTLVKPQGVSEVGSSQDASGTTCAGAAEASGDNPEIRNSQTTGNRRYETVVVEASEPGWPSGRLYEVEIYANGGSVTTLYFKNEDADADVVEGVTVAADLGTTTLPESYTVIVTQLDSCP